MATIFGWTQKLATWDGGQSPPPPTIQLPTSDPQMGENTSSAIKLHNMERQHPAQPLDKKKARKKERDAEGGNETINHGNIAQGLHAPCPDTMLPN